jgi:hypothetical protein
MVNTRIDINNHLSSLAANTITSYVENVSTMGESTAYQYLSRLKDFEKLAAKGYDLGVDSLILKIRRGILDPLDVLKGYATYLKNRNISPLTLIQRILF